MAARIANGADVLNMWIGQGFGEDGDTLVHGSGREFRGDRSLIHGLGTEAPCSCRGIQFGAPSLRRIRVHH